jgi:malonate decarboxylase gamma subunit
MAYDIKNYASLGLLWRILKLSDPNAPAAADIAEVRQSLEAALADIAADPERDLASRLQGVHRQASRKVRDMLREQWSADPSSVAKASQR